MHKLKFDAPHDFAQYVYEKYKEKFDLDYEGQPEIWVTNPNMDYVIDDHVLDLFPLLKVIATPSTGTNHIDVEACKKRGVKVISLLDNRGRLEQIYASSEFTFKLIIDALRLPPPRELHGKTIGLVGYGRIAKKLEKWCGVFGCTVFATDPYQFVPSRVVRPMDRIFAESDVVVLCCSLTDETRGMVTGDLLRTMKKGAALVNTSRGEVIDEDALVEVMKERADLKVAVDVLVGETEGKQNPQRLKKAGAIVTPHIAGATFESRTRAAEIIFDLLWQEFEHE